MKKILFIFALICSVVSIKAQVYEYVPTQTDWENTQERIIDLHAEIEIMTDGTVIITEFFTIYAAGIQIRRGINRDIPKSRVDKNGRKWSTPVSVGYLKHNGLSSEYVEDYVDDDYIIGFGNDDFLEHGVHQYELSYATRRHVGFFDDYDELYWNVMGGGCNFLIENISATLHPPAEAEAIQWSCYTGITGSTEQHCDCNDDKSAPTFTVTRPLYPKEAFTIAVAFPRDIVIRPTASQKFWFDYRNWIFGGITVLIMMTWMFFSWRKNVYKCGFAKQTVVPQFFPPNDWNAPKVRYMYLKKFDDKAFTVSLLQMAVKGAIGIENRLVGRKKRYFLIPKNDEALTDEEQKMYKKIFSAKKGKEIQEVEISSANNTYLSAAWQLLKTHTTKTPNADSLCKNNAAPRLLSLMFNLSIWFVYCLVFDYDNPDDRAFFIIPLALIVLHRIFRRVMRNPRTEFGAKTEAELFGLQMYLSTAEQIRFDKMMPPEQTPEHFEEMLPYAVALGVENQWCDKFHKVLKKLNYQPEWYDDKDFSTDILSGFLASNVLYELNRSITTSGAVRQPVTYSSGSSSSGSSSWSSGSSGGGSSGGGGGGGGVSGR